MRTHNRNSICMAVTVFLLAAASVAHATTWYVDASGNDRNGGSSSKPFMTIQRAADSARPGDTVLVRPGMYTSTSWAIVNIPNGGTPSQWITYKSLIKGEARLGNSPSSSYGFSFEPQANYIRIEGFDISGVSKLGIAIWEPNHDITIVANHLHDIGRYCTDTPLGLGAMYVQGSNVTIESNKMHDLGRFGPQEKGCQPGNHYYMNHDHGIYIDGGTNITVRGNQIHTVEHGWGIQVYGGSGKYTTNLTIVGNSFAFPNPNRDGHITLSTPGVNNATIADNSFFLPTHEAIDLEPGAAFSNVTVQHNMSYPVPISTSAPAGISFLSNF